MDTGFTRSHSHAAAKTLDRQTPVDHRHRRAQRNLSARRRRELLLAAPVLHQRPPVAEQAGLERQEPRRVARHGGEEQAAVERHESEHEQVRPARPQSVHRRALLARPRRRGLACQAFVGKARLMAVATRQHPGVNSLPGLAMDAHARAISS
jgi:hypothetical protein